MSERTLCNYCSLREIRRRARKRKATVAVTEGTGQWGGWFVVQASDEPKPCGYFRALSDRCVC